MKTELRLAIDWSDSIFRGSASVFCRELRVSGKFAITQRDEHFTLVPWRALLERQRGREVVGIVRGMGVSWQLGMHRDRGLSR